MSGWKTVCENGQQKRKTTREGEQILVRVWTEVASETLNFTLADAPSLASAPPQMLHALSGTQPHLAAGQLLSSSPSLFTASRDTPDWCKFIVGTAAAAPTRSEHISTPT